MPIEIRELVIKATVNQEQQTTASPAPTANTPAIANDNDSIIGQVVEEMLRIIELKKER